MEVTLGFLAILLGVTLTWIVRQSINVRPWAAEQGMGPGESDRLPPAATAARVGLGVLLAVITSFFMLSISAYTMRMELSGDWIPVRTPALLWFNTLLLVLGSLGLQKAWNAARLGERERVKFPFLWGGACTMAFIIGQVVAWGQLQATGQFMTGNPANSFFFLITALHGLHLLGGLVAWLRTLGRVRRGDTMIRIRVSVELCALYWHFLLLMWFVLFGLLLFT
jgi:cytochrome c oxidase subunit 3